MGSPRSSDVRQREAGKMCVMCRTPLDPPRPGEPTSNRRCDRCTPKQKFHMRFERCFETWRVTVSAVGGREVCRRTFASAEKVIEMARRGRAFKTHADRQAVEYALQSKEGLGITELQLTAAEIQRMTQGPKERIVSGPSFSKVSVDAQSQSPVPFRSTAKR